jgi:hypothetical protein
VIRTIQVIEVLAGAPLERMAAAEHVAERGELVADLETIHLLGELVTAGVWRRGEDGAPVAVISLFRRRPSFYLSSSPFTIHNWTTVSHPSPVQPNLRKASPLPTLSVRGCCPPCGPTCKATRSTIWRNCARRRRSLCAFTGLDFEHDEAAGDHLDAYIRWVQQVLARYAGTLIQLTTGDKGSYFYAAFGAPVAHDDDTRTPSPPRSNCAPAPAALPFSRRCSLASAPG